jgi:hypothetical protein
MKVEMKILNEDGTEREFKNFSEISKDAKDGKVTLVLTNETNKFNEVMSLTISNGELRLIPKQ